MGPTILLVSPVPFKSTVRRGSGIQAKYPTGKSSNENRVGWNPIFIIFVQGYGNYADRSTFFIHYW